MATKERLRGLEEQLTNCTRDTEAIGHILIQIVIELDRIAETQEEAHK